MAIVTRTLGLYTSVPSGQSGVIISIAPPAGQRCHVTSLFASGATQETGVEVRMGSNVLISGGTLDDTNGTRGVNTFCVGIRTAGVGDQFTILGGVDETFEVEKLAGSTATATIYSVNFVEDD